MRARALLLFAALGLAGCATDAPDAAGPTPVASFHEPTPPQDAPAQAPAASPIPRVAAAQVLPAAVAWAQAWAPEAKLVAVASALGEGSLARLRAPTPQPLDGRDFFWTFKFAVPDEPGALWVGVRGDGLVRLETEGDRAAPAEPVDTSSWGERESRWSAWLETDRLAAALASEPETASWSGAIVEGASIVLPVEDHGSAVFVGARRGDEGFYAIYDPTTWTRSVGGHVAANPEP